MKPVVSAMTTTAAAAMDALIPLLRFTSFTAA